MQAVMIQALVEEGVLSCAAMQARCCCDSQNALVQGRVCYPCAAMQRCCCCDSQNALVQEGCAILRCHASSLLHDPQNALVEEGCAIPAAMQARCCCDSQNALVQEGCAIPALPCKLAAVVIHRMLWWKKGVLSLRCHASSLLL
jgi:hypothetical protein